MPGWGVRRYWQCRGSRLHTARYRGIPGRRYRKSSIFAVLFPALRRVRPDPAIGIDITLLGTRLTRRITLMRVVPRRRHHLSELSRTRQCWRIDMPPRFAADAETTAHENNSPAQREVAPVSSPKPATPG